MEMKVVLTFACMNLKKLAKLKHEWGLKDKYKTLLSKIFRKNSINRRETALGLAS